MKTQPKSLDLERWIQTNSWWSTAVLCTILALLFAMTTLWNSLLNREQSIRDLIKSDTIVVSAESDPRKKNIFYSTLDFFKKIRSLDTMTAAFISAEARVGVIDGPQQNLIERPISVLLVSDNFWKHTQGSFTWGREFSYQDFISDAPYAVITPQALQLLTGTGSKPSQIEIEGRQFQIIGEYSFAEERAKENSMVILPMGALKLLGSEKKTYVNRFLVDNKDGQGLNRLKKVIDLVQLNAGYSPSRPEFSVELIAPTSSAASVYQKALVPCLVALYCLFLGALVNSLNSLYRTVFSYNSIIIDRLVAGWKIDKLSSHIWSVLILRYMKLCALSMGVVGLSLFLVAQHLNMVIWPNLSIVLVACFAVYPLLSWFLIKTAVKRQQMIIFSEALFPLPGKWDIDRSA